MRGGGKTGPRPRPGLGSDLKRVVMVRMRGGCGDCEDGVDGSRRSLRKLGYGGFERERESVRV